jgi:hypothetical protein
VVSIKAETTARRKRAGAESLGREAILAQHPHSCPKKIKRSPARASTPRPRTGAENSARSYARFVDTFRSASEKLKGAPGSALPEWLLPAGLPFVGWD